MKRPSEIAKDENVMNTLSQLTSIFEGIASMRISQIKNQVLQSTAFFNELWNIYTQIRVEDQLHYGNQLNRKIIDKNLYIIITSEGGLSGDIDQKLVRAMLETYDASKNDIVVIGHHGAVLLDQRGVRYKKFFKLPVKDQNINISPINEEIQQYKATTVFYQEYISLMTQNVKQIELLFAVRNISQKTDKPDEVISDKTYIFEPSTLHVVAHLERSMVKIAITQLILQSKLAQYASRFKAMTASNELAIDATTDLRLQLNRAKRAVKDERLKEMINGLNKARVGV